MNSMISEVPSRAHILLLKEHPWPITFPQRQSVEANWPDHSSQGSKVSGMSVFFFNKEFFLCVKEKLQQTELKRQGRLYS